MKRLLLPLVALAVAAGPLVGQPRLVSDPYRTTIDLNLRLYTDPVIQAELKLTDEQKAKIAKIPDDLLAKHKDAIEKEKSSTKEASEKSAALQADLQKKFDTLIEKNLTAEQRKRLGQMTTQAMGVSAFRNAEIAKALALPDDYQAKLREIQSAGQEKLLKEFPNGLRGFGGPGGTNNDEQQKYTEAMRKMAKDTVAQFVDTFTDEQKKKWKELTGEPWEAGTSGTARGTGTPFGPSLGALFSPGTTVYWQNHVIGNGKALDELKVEKSAREALAEGLKTIQEASRATGGGPGGFGGGFNSVSRTIAMETSPAADQVLTAPQAKRLEQIRFQMSGTGVFSLNRGLSYEYVTATGGGSGAAGALGVSPSPLLKLSLTPAQVKKIDAVLADVAAKQRELGPQRGGFGFFGSQPLTEAQKKALEAQEKARAEYQQKVNAIEQKALADITATFDAGQKAAWNELTGEPIDVLKLLNTTSSRRGPGGFGGGPIGRGGTTTSIISQWSQEASRRMTAGEYAAALATYDEAIRLAPTNTLFVQNKARLLASCPSEWVRDGKQAVELMKKVMGQTKEPTYTQYDVLAMSHAEAGQFDEAVKAQEKAIALLPPPVNPDDTGFTGGGGGFAANLKPQYEARLKLYQEKKPYRIEPRPSQPRLER